MLTRWSCNTVGTALALGLASASLLACESKAPFTIGSQQEEGQDNVAALQPGEAVEPSDTGNPPDGSMLTSNIDAPPPPSSEVPAPPVGVDPGTPPSTDPMTVPPPPVSDCWQLPVITRARLLPAPGRAAALVGGKIMGSNRSAMNDFVDLGVVASASEGAWVELTFANPAAYRYVKFYGAPASYGALAEVEFYAGDVRLSGAQFGTDGSRDDSGNTFDRALDGDPATFFEGPLANDGYVGLDVHRAARVGSAAHGGQILLSDATRLILAPRLPRHASMRRVGLVRLKGVPGHDMLWQLDAPDLQQVFAEPRVEALLRDDASSPI